jgi:hypothetical protein
MKPTVTSHEIIGPERVARAPLARVTAQVSRDLRAVG